MIASLIANAPASVRNSQRASRAYSTHFVALHTNATLRRKCLPQYSLSTRASRATWLKRHGYAHRRPRGSCLPAHYAGWACIHRGEGNSYSGTYTGWLQMTNPWMGMSAPGGSWANLGSGVYAVAERVMARSGFSYSAMRGQWPNTFPPCAGYF